MTEMSRHEFDTTLSNMTRRWLENGWGFRSDFPWPTINAVLDDRDRLRDEVERLRAERDDLRAGINACGASSPTGGRSYQSRFKSFRTTSTPS